MRASRSGDPQGHNQPSAISPPRPPRLQRPRESLVTPVGQAGILLQRVVGEDVDDLAGGVRVDEAQVTVAGPLLRVPFFVVQYPVQVEGALVAIAVGTGVPH